jgi:hypothetical protein
MEQKTIKKGRKEKPKHISVPNLSVRDMLLQDHKQRILELKRCIKCNLNSTDWRKGIINHKWKYDRICECGITKAHWHCDLCKKPKSPNFSINVWIGKRK